MNLPEMLATGGLVAGGAGLTHYLTKEHYEDKINKMLGEERKETMEQRKALADLFGYLQENKKHDYL